jgi:type IV pilus assembly protein PilY1
MKRLKRLLAVCLCLAILPLNVPLARSDDSEIFGANIQPNIMIFLDSSGSMIQDKIIADPYNVAQTYTGTYTPTVVYKYASQKYSLYANTVDAVKDSKGNAVTAAQTALNSVGFWSGKINKTTYDLYLGNYLNWQATPGAQLVPKIDVAKRVVKNIVNNTEGVRFGLSIFKNNTSNATNDGAVILSQIGASISSINTQIDGINPSGYTPMGEALRDIGLYYKGQSVHGTTYTSPIQFSCQPNFVIMMTDGLQNGDTTHYDIRNVATDRFTQDHSLPLDGVQNVIVSTIGFAVAGTEKVTANAVLKQAAQNGGGSFYDTESETQLEAALQDAIRKMVAATFTFATPVLPTTSATGLSRAYLAAVQSNPMRPSWRGFLKAYNRDANGQVLTNTDGTPNESASCYVDPPNNTKPCLAWEAGSVLNTKLAADRLIYTATALNGSRETFSTANSNITALRLGAADDTERAKIIDFIRGVDTVDEDGNGNFTEQRVWKLGDIFHSTPVVVGAPFLPGDSSYESFRSTYSGRTAVVIAGSNDGMLHAFRESTGVELWAFIPPDLLPRLKELTHLTGEHEFYVDASPVAADIKVGSDWKTIVIFGERRGGGVIHALDITNPSDPYYPRYLWSFTDSKMTESWSEPVIGKVKVSNGSGGFTDKYVAFFGAGYESASNNTHGAAFFALDLATGAKLWEYSNNGTTDNDRKYMRFSIPGNPLALDLDNDGYLDRIYIGDVGGQLWKFDISAVATIDGTSHLVTNWTGKRLFRPMLDTATADPSPPNNGEYHPTQAIYGSPNATLDKDKNLWLYFGTGDRNHPNNLDTTNRFYGIKDTTDMTNLSTLRESDLVAASTIVNTTTINHGWYIALGTAEKVLAAADVFNSVVFYSTFTPSTTQACGTGGGTARLAAVQITSSYAAIDWNSTNKLAFTASNPSDATKDKSTIIGTGIPSKPVVIITDSGTSASVSTTVIAATTSQQLPTNPAPPPSTMRRILYWKENF